MHSGGGKLCNSRTRLLASAKLALAKSRSNFFIRFFPPKSKNMFMQVQKSTTGEPMGTGQSARQFFGQWRRAHTTRRKCSAELVTLTLSMSPLPVAVALFSMSIKIHQINDFLARDFTIQKPLNSRTDDAVMLPRRPMISLSFLVPMELSKVYPSQDGPVPGWSRWLSPWARCPLSVFNVHSCPKLPILCLFSAYFVPNLI
jgi:hypothetical protein